MRRQWTRPRADTWRRSPTIAKRCWDPARSCSDIARDDADQGVRLTVRFELDDQVWESATVGETIVDAHARLRNKLLIDRIRIGFTEYVMPR